MLYGHLHCVSSHWFDYSSNLVEITSPMHVIDSSAPTTKAPILARTWRTNVWLNFFSFPAALPKHMWIRKSWIQRRRFYTRTLLTSRSRRPSGWNLSKTLINRSRYDICTLGSCNHGNLELVKLTSMISPDFEELTSFSRPWNDMLFSQSYLVWNVLYPEWLKCYFIYSLGKVLPFRCFPVDIHINSRLSLRSCLWMGSPAMQKIVLIFTCRITPWFIRLVATIILLNISSFHFYLHTCT